MAQLVAVCDVYVWKLLRRDMKLNVSQASSSSDRADRKSGCTSLMRVLAYTSPARGHLYPLVPILAELTARGQRTTVVALSGELGHLTQLGIEGSAIDTAVERIQIEDWRKRSLPRAGSLSVLKTFTARSAGEAPDLARAIARFEPDALAYRRQLLGRRDRGRVLGAAMGGVLALPAAAALPAMPHPSGSGWRRWAAPPGGYRDAIVGRGFHIGFDRAVMPTVNALRTQHELPALDRYSDLLERPPLLLALTAEGFEYPRSDWPANVRLIGAAGTGSFFARAGAGMAG